MASVFIGRVPTSIEKNAVNAAAGTEEQEERVLREAPRYFHVGLVV